MTRREISLSGGFVLGCGAHGFACLRDQLVGACHTRPHPSQRAPEKHRSEQRGDEGAGEYPHDQGHEVMLDRCSASRSSESVALLSAKEEETKPHTGGHPRCSMCEGSHGAQPRRRYSPVAWARVSALRVATGTGRRGSPVDGGARCPTGGSPSEGRDRQAGGSFVATLERKGTAGTLAWRLTFRDLSGKATAAHVHLGKRGRPGPVALALCRSCRSGARSSTKAGPGAVQALLTGGAYVNVHTARNPAGEIRGQVRAGSMVPPPPTTTTTTTTTTRRWRSVSLARPERASKRRRPERLRFGACVEHVGLREKAVHGALEAHDLHRHTRLARGARHRARLDRGVGRARP